jgi:hypothetical protein
MFAIHNNNNNNNESPGARCPEPAREHSWRPGRAFAGPVQRVARVEAPDILRQHQRRQQRAQRVEKHERRAGERADGQRHSGGRTDAGCPDAGR